MSLHVGANCPAAPGQAGQGRHECQWQGWAVLHTEGRAGLWEEQCVLHLHLASPSEWKAEGVTKEELGSWAWVWTGSHRLVEGNKQAPLGPS